MPQDHLKDEYITLQEAAKLCRYSQEYLSLRSRQGKLKALKFGRNWVTKNNWVEDYLRETGNPNQGPRENKDFIQAPSLDNFSSESNSFSLARTEISPTVFPAISIRLAVGVFLLFLIFGGILILRQPIRHSGETPSYKSTALQLASAFTPEAMGLTLNTFFEYGRWLYGQTLVGGEDIKAAPQKISPYVKKLVFSNFQKENGDFFTAKVEGQNFLGIFEIIQNSSRNYLLAIQESLFLGSDFIAEKKNWSKELISRLLVKKIEIENPAL